MTRRLVRAPASLLVALAAAVAGTACGGSSEAGAPSRAEVERIVARDFESGSGTPTAVTCTPAADGWSCTMRIGRERQTCDGIEVDGDELVASNPICVVE